MKSITRRITQELDENISKKNKSVTVEYDYKNTSATVTIDNKRFHLNQSYPFSKPEVFVNNLPYKRYLTPPTKRIYRMLNDLKYKCLCCNSLLKDWSPVYRLVKILDEIENFNCIKRMIKYRLAIEELGNKYQIISQIPNCILEYL